MVAESKQQIRESSLELLSSNTINHPIGPLTQRAMFWRPAYLESSAWLEHIPFAFWLVEAHHPHVFVELGAHHCVSYFAFCQAVEKLELDARCFAVGTWKGDAQAGFYDEGVFEQVKAYNDAQYSGFSRLVRSAFDDALSYFSDGSIDLLHIDGLHTIKAASHDFESWLPKLSKRAVVVMHDTNVRERKFGVFKLFESLRERYSAFEFFHGHGLGVLKVGPRQTDQMLRLFRSAEKDQTKHAVHEIFSRLGQACADSFSAAQQMKNAHSIKNQVEEQQKQLEEAKQSLEKNKTDLHKRTKELANIGSQMQTQIEQHAVARGQLDEQVTLLQETDNKQRVEIKILEMRLAEAERELVVAQKSQKDDSARYKNDMSSRETEVEQLTETISILQQELDQSQSELGGRNEIIKRLNKKLSTQTAEMECLQQDLESRFEEIGKERWYLGERDAEIGRLTETLAAREQELEQAQNDLSERNEAAGRLEQAQALEFAHLQQEKINQLNDNERLQWYLGERDAEIGRFTETLAVIEQELNQAQNDMGERDEATKRLQQKLDEHIAEAQTLNEALAEKIAENEGLTRRLSEQDETLKDTKEALQAREEEVANYELEREGLTEEMVKLTQIIEVAETTLEKREDELVQLKQLSEGRSQELDEVRGKLSKLTNESQVQLEQTQQTHKTLESANKEIAEDNELLLLQLHQVQKELETTFLQMQQLEQGQKDHDAQQQQLQTQIEQLTKSLDVQAKQSTEQNVRLEQVQKDCQTLEATKKKSLQENELLSQQLHQVQEKLEETFLRNQNLKLAHQRIETAKKEAVKENETLSRNLYQVREELLIKDEEIETQRQRVTKLKQTVSWKMTAPLRAIAKIFKRSIREQKKTDTQVKLLKNSGLFDEAWYLAENEDVAREGTDPVEHYLRYGAEEGRNPSSLFNTQFYLESNPDVAATGVNPLVHFVKYGKTEGRKTSNQEGRTSLPELFLVEPSEA